jgi:small subunit ribosomal protein S1
VTEVCNGGFRVMVMGKTAFCPISQIDLRRVDDSSSYIGRKFDFMVTQFSERGRNIVVSRRRLLEEQQELSQSTFMEAHKVGDIVSGVVSRLEKFGAFVELTPGVDGLVHISEISWTRLNDPSEAVRAGQEVAVKILKIEDVGGRTNISLSMKQATSQPWENLPAALSEGAMLEGKVTRCLKFGAFVELFPGIEGLVPLSEMSHTKRVLRSDELFKEGDRITVLIKEVRVDERRLLLSLKDAGGDPWAMVPLKFTQGTVIRGRVERREPYGLFVKLDEGVIGLLPKSKAMESPDISYDKFKIGDEITVEIAELRVDERRISLSVPLDPNAEVWKGFSASGQPAKTMGTLGDQFKTLFSASTNEKKK